MIWLFEVWSSWLKKTKGSLVAIGVVVNNGISSFALLDIGRHRNRLLRITMITVINKENRSFRPVDQDRRRNRLLWIVIDAVINNNDKVSDKTIFCNNSSLLLRQHYFDRSQTITFLESSFNNSVHIDLRRRATTSRLHTKSVRNN